MIEKLETRSDKVVAYRATGEMTEDDMKRIGPALDDRIRDKGTANLLLDVRDYEKMTPGALFEEAQLAGKMKNMDKVAVVGNEGAQKTMSDLANLIGDVSDTSVQFFKDREEAELWVSKEEE